MLIYSNPFYTEDDGRGYSLSERDAICSKCHAVIDRQVKYKGIDTDFRFSSKEKASWEYCPHCAEKLHERIAMEANKINMCVENNTTIVQIGGKPTSLSKDETVDLFNDVLSKYGFLIISKEQFGEMYKSIK